MNRIVLACTVTVLGGATAQAQTPTPLEQIIAYGANNDNPNRKLLRYTFRDDLWTSVGDIIDQYGNSPKEIECFAAIPSGPNKGFYGVSNYLGSTNSRLIKISPLDASATRYPDDIGFGFVVGMIAYQEIPGDVNSWTLYATQGGLSAPVRRLIRIDPSTGVAVDPGDVLHVIEAFSAYQGLAVGSTEPHVFYGVTNWSGDGTLGPKKATLRKIDFGPLGLGPPVESVVGVLWPNTYTKVESLEFGFGLLSPQLDIPTVPQTWMDNGVLMAFDDITDDFFVINPDTAELRVISPCSLAATDVEGLIFFNERTDPRNPLDNGFD